MSYYYLFLSFIQGATEFLPVSSSGHLLFFKGIFDLADIPVIFDIILHLGSLTAILYFYRKKLTYTVGQAFVEVRTGKNQKTATKFILYICISTLVTFIFYLFFKKPIESGFESVKILKYTFTVTSLIVFATMFSRKVNFNSITQKNIFSPIMVGLIQAMAIMPGISRSGSTIACMMFLKVDKEEAAYYSFFLAIPAILGAFIFKISEIQNISYLSENWLLLSFSLISSAVFSYFFLKLLTYVISKKKFWLFSLYTLAMSITSLIIFK